MNEDPQGALCKVIAKAWSGADFKQRLLADPKAALAEIGLVAPERLAGMTVTVSSRTPTTTSTWFCRVRAMARRAAWEAI